jgi:two-component system sensor histidine kinase CiaH
MFRSLRMRLALSHAFVMLVILGIVAGLVLLLLARSLDRGATDQLAADARAQVERIQEGGSFEPTADVDVPSSSAVQLAVYRSGETVPVGEPKEIPSWLRPYPDRVTDLEIAGERVRVVTLPAVLNGQTVARVSAGRSLEPEEALIHRVRSLFLWGGLGALAASLVAGWWWAGRAVKPVQESYEAQAGFAADASHELRTPLTFIRAGVETLAQQDPALAADVLSEVDYLTGLSQRLLQLARADRGQLQLELSIVDLAASCRSAAHRSSVAHGNRLSSHGPEHLDVPADRIALEAVLDAVLENVARHGGGAAEVRWGVDGAREAVITIEDHGKGMPVEAHHRAFERFFRADPSRTRDTGGAGLGLALARALVEAQRGRMWLEPTPGGGLTASIALPLS